VSRRLTDHGFRFDYPTFRDALDDLVGPRAA
jgi:hypothetical protein